MINEKTSLAYQATITQNLNTKNCDELYTRSKYPKQDKFQNSLILNGNNSIFYCFATESDVNKFKTKNKNHKLSGFFTDESTINKCVKNGIIDLDKLATMLQVTLKKDEEDNRFYPKPFVIAFNIDWEKLEKTDNKIKVALCDFDGKKDGRDSIEVASGKVEANKYHGIGGGNQYFITQDAFNLAIENDIFNIVQEKSFLNISQIKRKGISFKEYDKHDNERIRIIKTIVKRYSNLNVLDAAKKYNDEIFNKKNEIDSYFSNIYNRKVIEPNYAYDAPNEYMKKQINGLLERIDKNPLIKGADKKLIVDLLKNRVHWEEKHKSYFTENIDNFIQIKERNKELDSEFAKIENERKMINDEFSKIDKIKNELLKSQERETLLKAENSELKKENTELKKENAKLKGYETIYNEIKDMNPNILDDLEKYQAQQRARENSQGYSL